MLRGRNAFSLPLPPTLVKKCDYIECLASKRRKITIKTSFFSFIAILSFKFVILRFLSSKNGLIQSNKYIFVEKVQRIFIEKLPQIHFSAFLCDNFSKNFKFSKLFVNRAPLAHDGPLLWARLPCPPGDRTWAEADMNWVRWGGSPTNNFALLLKTAIKSC